MKFFATKTTIQAPAEAIWNLLTDGPNWTAWNPTVDRVEGTIAQGQKITVHAKISPGRAFPVVVSTLTSPEKMVWTGAMPLGLFTGERTYLLTPQDDGSVEFSMREEFTGLLAPLFTRSIPDLQPAFEAFAAGLKEHAETSAA
jgi:hypothetical protein